MNRRVCSLAITLSLLSAGIAQADDPLFGREVVPILYKLGCSSGPCHGSFSGKGGFRLSLFASDPEADYREIRGFFNRRINLQNPEESLLLLKRTGKIPHGGSLRLRPGSEEYQLIKRWIEAGLPYAPEAEGRVMSVRVEPSRFVIPIDTAPTALKVFARLQNGSELEVTRFVRFEAFDPTIGEVDDNGSVTARRSGDTHILAHYTGQIGYTFALVPQPLPKGLAFPQEKITDH